ncbi:MAG: YezD family protein [Erythrobacter sp.]
MDTNKPTAAGVPQGVLTAALEVVSEALTRLRFGAVNLVVHDGKVVQIDVTEKKRLND